MARDAQTLLEPRKAPAQARSTATVEAISEATIQVLLTHGTDRLTTTLVAARAGVSVGTLYQYYPNKRSLLFALLREQLDHVSTAVETACAQAHHKPLRAMIEDLVEAFVDAKMRRTDISTALYEISTDVGGPMLVKRTGERFRDALHAMLTTAPDVTLPQEDFAIQMLYAAMAGATRSVLEAGASPAMVRQVREHLVLLCQSYAMALAQPRG